MARTKEKKREEPSAEEPRAEETGAEEVETGGDEKPKKIEYAFPSKVRCRRCASTQTEAYGTHGSKQYRRCLVPVCRHRFVIEGTEI